MAEVRQRLVAYPPSSRQLRRRPLRVLRLQSGPEPRPRVLRSERARWVEAPARVGLARTTYRAARAGTAPRQPPPGAACTERFPEGFSRMERRTPRPLQYGHPEWPGRTPRHPDAIGPADLRQEASHRPREAASAMRRAPRPAPP